MGVALIGWTDQVPTALEQSAIRLDESDLRGPFPAHVAALVIGPEALESFSPTWLSERLDCFGGTTLVVNSPDAPAGWSDAQLDRLGERVHPGDVQRRAREVLARRPLPRMPVCEWVGERRTSFSAADRDLLRLVPGLSRLRANAWATAAGISEHRLSAATRRLFGVAAGAALREYRVRAACIMRDRGCTLEAIAPIVGYSSRSSVSRALRT